MSSEFEQEKRSFSSEQFDAFRRSAATLQILANMISPLIEEASKDEESAKDSFFLTDEILAELGIGQTELCLQEDNRKLSVSVAYTNADLDDDDPKPLSEHGCTDLPASYQELGVKWCGEVTVKDLDVSHQEVGNVFWRVEDEDSALKGGAIIIQEPRQKFTWQVEITPEYKREMLLFCFEDFYGHLTDEEKEEKLAQPENPTTDTVMTGGPLLFGARKVLTAGKADELSAFLLNLQQNGYEAV